MQPKKEITFIQSETSAHFQMEIGTNLVIVGANGSGKSIFGSRLEQINGNSKRISEQRLLKLKEEIQKQDY